MLYQAEPLPDEQVVIDVAGADGLQVQAIDFQIITVLHMNVGGRTSCDVHSSQHTKNTINGKPKNTSLAGAQDGNFRC